ncbi:MAG: hypothetical protein Fur0037_20430 [Planctomycetota bacterium]
MYSILLSVSLALLVALGGMLGGFWGWIWAIAIGLVVFVIASVLISRRLMARLGPAMGAVRRQMESGMLDVAQQSLRDLLPLARWAPLLAGQIQAQMGVIAYYKQDEKEAVALLRKATRRAPEAQLLLACIHYKNGDKQEALRILRLASQYSKKHSMLHNALAWMLQREERSDEATAVLVRYLKKESDDPIAKDNLLRLQNNQRTSMKGFGLEWYAMGLEHPPAKMGQLQTVRKGFRTPPKKPRQQKQRSKKKR